MSNGADNSADIKLKAFESVSEWSRHIVTIASATLVLSATFIKDITSGQIVRGGSLLASWIVLLLSILAGVFVLSALIARLNKGRIQELDVYGRAIMGTAMAQVTLFVLGMGLFISFVSVNFPLSGTRPKNSEIPAKRERLNMIDFFGQVEDAYFDFNKSDVRSDTAVTLAQNAGVLKIAFREVPNVTAVVEGHCDRRGAAELNSRLGYRRAAAAREFLIRLGVPGEKLRVVSYGKDRLLCNEPKEECWQRNRRVHIAPDK